MSCSLMEKRHFLVIIISVRFWSTQLFIILNKKGIGFVFNAM